jgi:hypothetical protein
MFHQRPPRGGRSASASPKNDLSGTARNTARCRQGLVRSHSASAPPCSRALFHMGARGLLGAAGRPFRSLRNQRFAEPARAPTHTPGARPRPWPHPDPKRFPRATPAGVRAYEETCPFNASKESSRSKSANPPANHGQIPTRSPWPYGPPSRSSTPPQKPVVNSAARREPAEPMSDEAVAVLELGF